MITGEFKLIILKMVNVKMEKLFFYIFLCVTIKVGSGNKGTSKIMGGVGPVDIVECPFAASVQYLGHHTCSANIISHNHLVTVASCVFFYSNIIAGNLKVLTGTNDRLNTLGTGEYHNVRYVIQHPEYQPEKYWKHDICILKLESTITWSGNADKIHLPTYRIRINDAVVSYGWGEGFFLITGPSQFLEKLTMKSIHRIKCANDFGPFFYFTINKGCAVSDHPDSGITKGDGGNGLIRYDGTVHRLHGIISLYSVFTMNSVAYTKIFHYNAFIRENLWKY